MEKRNQRSTSSPLVFLLLLVVLLAASHRASGRLCESQSHGFKGRCVSDHNCGLVCRNEHFSGGKCRGFRGRCFCTRPC